MSTTNGQPYPFGYGDAELQRLGEQHRNWEEANQRFLSRAGFGEGDTLVDLGCGPGFTTLDPARRVGPTGRIIAVDRDGELRVTTKAVRPDTLEWRWPDTLFRQLLPKLVDNGHLAREILDDFIADWEDRSQNPSNFFFSSPVLEVIGRRRGASNASR